MRCTRGCAEKNCKNKEKIKSKERRQKIKRLQRKNYSLKNGRC
jgi:hypothetical protein